MPYDGNGNYVRVHNWAADQANGLDINATEMDAEDNSIASALSNAVTRDGQGKMGVDFLPNADNTLNLGNGSFRWATINGLQINSIISGIYYKQTSAEALASIVPTVFTYPPGDVRRYGGDPTGLTNSSAAWTSNIAQASQTGGNDMIGPGTYLLVTGLVISTNGVKLRTSGMGGTTFKAGANNIDLLKVSSSYCVIGDFNVDANGFTGVGGLTLAPGNEADTTHTSQINFNEFGAIQLLGGLKEGIRMRAGPTVATVDSGMFYNRFAGVWPRDCIRSIWMQDTIAAGTGGPYRNIFMGCRAGSSGTTCNTGIQIDVGSTNQFFGLHMEGISNGTTPNTVPTAVKIANAGANTVSNNDNQFFGCFMESNTRDLDNSNPTTIIVGGFWTATKFATGGSTVYPGMVLTCNPSQLPVAIPGLLYGEGIAGFPSGYWGMTKEIADSGKQWQAYALTTTTVSNTASVVNATSNYRQLANVVEWAGVCQFNATAAGTQVNITPPVAPNAAQYTALFGNAPFYTFSVNNGVSVVQVAGGWTSTGKLYFAVPSGNWNTVGNNNAITFQVSYHI